MTAKELATLLMNKHGKLAINVLEEAKKEINKEIYATDEKSRELIKDITKRDKDWNFVKIDLLHEASLPQLERVEFLSMIYRLQERSKKTL